MASKNVRVLAVLTFLLTCSMLTPASAQRVMDLVRVEGERIHFMIAHGLVGGLAGKGDSAKSPLAKALLAGALEHTGLSSDDGQLDSLVGKNVAVVMVTAEISSRMKAGATIEARVASVQDASSIEGGELFLTNLHGVGEGVDRFLARAQGGIRTDGRSPRTGVVRAILLRDIEIPPRVENGYVKLLVETPEFSTAEAITRAINECPWLLREFGTEGALATTEDAGCVRLKIPLSQQSEERLASFLSRVLAEVQVRPVSPEAKVVIQRAAGRVFINGQVRVAPVTILTKNFELTLKGDPTRTGAPSYDLLIDVLEYLAETEGVAEQEWPEIIRGLFDANALIGKLEEQE